MEFITQISFDEIVAALVSCILIREVLIFSLPDDVAGPGGWFIDTGSDEA